MDGGGVSRKRGYLWLAAVLLAALLIVVFMGLLLPDRQQPMQQVATAATDSLEELRQLSQPQPARERCGGSGYRSSHQHTAYVSSSVQGPNPQESQPVSPPEHIYRKSKRVIVELNSADSLDLVQLYDVGPTFAKRILKYRALLGGFVSKEQLWEVYGMDSVRYNHIAPYVTIDCAGVTPLDLNSATVDQLKSHPYLDYYQAKAIVSMRQQNGPYQDLQGLLMVPIIDKETYIKIKPYLTCNSQQNR